jgi:hypothetical protein
MRLVKHLAFELHRAGASRPLEGSDHGGCMAHLLLVRRVTLIDGVDLIRVNRDFSRESGAPRRSHLARKTRLVPKIRRDGIDGLHAGRVGAEKAQRPRKLVGELVLAAVDAVGAGADGRRQVFRAPRQAGESRRRATIAVECEHRLRRFGCDGHDADRCRRNGIALLERGQVVIEHDDVFRRFHLR